MEIHWIATFLDPSFRELAFVNNKSYRLKPMKNIEAALFSMAANLKIEHIHKYMRVSQVFITINNECELIYTGRLMNLQSKLMIKLMIHFRFFVLKNL